MAEASAPVAKVVRSRAALAESVARWQEARTDTTWALVVVGEIPSAPQLQAVRQAARTCDRVAALVLPAKPGEAAKTLPELPALLRTAGCDVVWVPGAEKTPLLVVRAGHDGTVKLMLQALLAVLPSVIVAGRADAATLKLWRLIQTEFGEVADVMLA
jgi:hypothetical protein